MASSTTENKKTKKLYLSTEDKKLFGVCGGIAEYFQIDSTVVRLAWIVFTALTAIVPGIIAYIVAAVVMPSRAEKE